MLMFMPIPDWVATIKWNRTLGQKMRLLREARGFSRNSLSNEIAKRGDSVSSGTIQRIEVGFKPNDPTQFPKAIEVETLVAIINALEMSEDDWIEYFDQFKGEPE